MKGLAKALRMAGHAPLKIDFLQSAINVIIAQVRSNIIALVQFTQSDSMHMQLALPNSTFKVLGSNLDECEVGTDTALFCARLFICALWSPAGKGLTSWLSFVVSSVSLSLSHWYPGSGVVLDCIDS